MKGIRYQIHSATWVRGAEKFTMRADEYEPIYTEDIESWRAKMIGDADYLYLTYTTYES